MSDSEDLKTIKELFLKADVDKNGSINRQELAMIMSMLMQDNEPSQQDIDKVFSSIDTDKSGSIDLDEFSTVLLEWVRISKDSGIPTSPLAQTPLDNPRAEGNNLNRRKIQSEIKNFFHQFEVKSTDPRQSLQKILSKNSKSFLSLKNIRRGIRTYTNDEKSEIHTRILNIIQNGSNALNNIIVLLNSNINDDIYNGLLNVHELLLVNEVFTTNSER